MDARTEVNDEYQPADYIDKLLQSHTAFDRFSPVERYIINMSKAIHEVHMQWAVAAKEDKHLWDIASNCLWECYLKKLRELDSTAYFQVMAEAQGLDGFDGAVEAESKSKNA